RSQRGNPPENRRGTLLPLGALAGRLPAARGVISSAVFCASRVSCSTLGTDAGATAGLPRYFASDSPGRMISSSGALGTEGAALVISARRHAWRGCILRRRQVAPARATLRASAAMASTTSSPTATPAAIPATISASVATAAKILTWAIVAATGGVVLRWIVVW